MEELRDRLDRARPSNWEHWPTVKGLWPWFAALGLIAAIAIPWGIRAEERSLEAASREALSDAGFRIEDVSFTGRQATITADLDTSDKNAIIGVLADLGGVSRVSWREGTGLFVAPPPPTTVPPTTTAAPEPGAEVTAAVSNGRITLRGTVPAAGTIKDLSDAAGDLWGAKVVNQLFVDSAVIAHPWLPAVDEAVGVLPMLIDPQLTLDAEGATITGGAIDRARLDDVLSRFSMVLGPEVAIDSKVVVTQLDLPHFEIMSPGDGTASLTGTVANADVRKAVAARVRQSADELEITNEILISETTADVYLVRRVPEVIAALGEADQWMLRSDGAGIGGAAGGGKAFEANKVKATAAVRDLLELLSAFMQADPNLVLELEVHAEERERDVDSSELAQARANAMAAHMVRLGIDPDRVSAAEAAGEGELLRFQLIPADQ